MSPMDKIIGMQALSGLSNSHPLLKVAFKYWWLAVPSSIAMYTLVKERKNRTMATYIQDFATSFGPIVGLIVLAENMERKEAQVAVNATALQPQNVRDASFSIKETTNPEAGFPQFAEQG